MSTRGIIAIKGKDKISSIYCHFDCYLQGVGRILLNHYLDEKKIKLLMKLGDLSTLGEEIGKKHDFTKHDGDKECNAYGRDRGENGVGCHKVNDEHDLMALADGSWAEYVYLFKDGKWHWSVVNKDHFEFRELEEKDVAIKE